MSMRRGSARRNTRSHRRERTTRRLPRTSKLDHLRWLLLRWSWWVLWRCVSRVPRISISRVHVPPIPLGVRGVGLTHGGNAVVFANAGLTGADL